MSTQIAEGAAGSGPTPTVSAPDPGSLSSLATHVGGSVAVVGTALAYLGWLSYRSRAAAIGIEVRVLGLEQRDYALTAVGLLVVPLVLLAGAVLVALVADVALIKRLTIAPILARRAAWTSRAFAFALCLVAVVLLLRPQRTAVGLAPAILALALALWLYGRRLDRLHPRPGAVPVTPVLVRISVTWLMTLLLFWAGTEYAIGVGYRSVSLSAADLPRVALFAERDLGPMRVPSVTVTVAGDPEVSGSPYEYEGFRLLSYVPQKSLVLVGDTWKPRRGPVVVLPDDGSWRLVYGPDF